MRQYGEAVDHAGSPTELVDVATAIFREDLDAGYVAVLVEMIAGHLRPRGWDPKCRRGSGRGSPSPNRRSPPRWGLRWMVCCRRDVAYAIVALYLGLEMLTTSTAIAPGRSVSSPTPRTWPRSLRR